MDIEISTVYLIRILSFLLDNALEAVEQRETPQVQIHFSKDNTSTTITVANSYLPLDDKIYLSIFKKNHKDIGLAILSRSLKQYKNVRYTINKDPTTFTTTLTITAPDCFSFFCNQTKKQSICT
ncbi:hypothetical protein UAW_01747 [Enterococcus haemoperoxidus ATCC BAA-382]|uniref:Sensor histidine kinase NatK-like C-terminal domain-containing protein n=1 Tax=Enterococcus haemoperoxidus ATCC BAA-382 TaxID=1158608 RepID=R2T968_9ENTE|nr:GHKL domain-containing protein [Enterococcus haemoperoxidus]EOH96789.1 hypothetical protein UAW_01747 [Enterococcus haemoperoxidus ATCC BAA-382]EOT60078.1 hypothetical protein I583_02713 [Enterococcus haemoperoxidus ATCC BAA-382]